MYVLELFTTFTKGQLISKANFQAVNSSRKRTNEFVFTTMRRVFGRFFEEIEDTKKTFRNHLTFNKIDSIDQSIASTKTKYIKLSTKTQIFFNNIRLLYTL